MSIDELEQLFALANNLYEEECDKAGVTVLPYAWAENAETGQFLAFSAFGKPSKEVKAMLEEHFRSGRFI